MKIISAHQGLLQTLSAETATGLARKSFRTELAALDDLLPRRCIATGAVHELLAEHGNDSPLSVAAMLAQAASRDGGTVVWSDPDRKLYPPALADAGISLDRLIVLRPANAQEESWAITHARGCLCP